MENTISKYDNTRGSLEMEKNGGAVVFTKPSTVRHVDAVTGKVEMFIVETARHVEKGDTIFVECMDGEAGMTRMALPPRVARAIARQRDAVATKVRKKVAKSNAQERKALGQKPGFMMTPKERAEAKARREKKKKGDGSGPSPRNVSRT